jgi:hypothetical protein
MNMSAFDDELKVTATEWLKLKSKLEAIEKDFKTLDETLKNKMHESNVKSIEIGDTVIELTVPARRSFDAAVLKDLVSAAVFNKVTKPTVDTQLMDAAIKMGTIKPEIADQVTKKTEYKQLRVK